MVGLAERFIETKTERINGMSGPPRLEVLESRAGVLPTPTGADRADILICDGFWPSAEQLRVDALGRDFQFFHSPGGFAFHTSSVDPLQAQLVAARITGLIGHELASARVESRFVIEMVPDEELTRKRIWVHYDEWIRIALLYLCPANAVGGTDFFRHRETGHYSIETISSQEEREAVLGDSTRMDAWEVVEHVEIRFNRLLLFRPHFFHQATCYFGSTFSDARLNQVFTFHAT